MTQEIKDSFSKTIADFEDVKKILIDQKYGLDYLEMEYSGDWNQMYEFEQEELCAITTKINKLKEKPSIGNADIHIRELRKKIEKVFQEME